jgi:hypothetical protein
MRSSSAATRGSKPHRKYTKPPRYLHTGQVALVNCSQLYQRPRYLLACKYAVACPSHAPILKRGPISATTCDRVHPQSNPVPKRRCPPQPMKSGKFSLHLLRAPSSVGRDSVTAVQLAKPFLQTLTKVRRAGWSETHDREGWKSSTITASTLYADALSPITDKKTPFTRPVLLQMGSL